MILWLVTFFLLKHFVADFLLQTQYQFEHKGIYGHWGGILHALIHAVGTAIVLGFFNWKFALVAALVDGVVHYHVDWLKTNTITHYQLTVNNHWFWYIFGLDQLIHQLTYVIIISLGLTSHALMG